MVKSKKGKKGTIVGDNGDSDVDVNDGVPSDDEESRQKEKPKKKDKKKVSKSSVTDDEIDIVESKVKDLKLGKKEKKSKKSTEDDDDEDDIPKVAKSSKKKEKRGGFDLLMADLSDDEDVEVKTTGNRRR